MNLTDVTVQLVSQVQDVYLDWLATFIKTLITGIGIVGVGVIVFTLILKTVILPFDIFQKINQRKQSLKMEEMRPELEKLQKQYANDKQMYSMKMMELYKKNNYSVFSACLPMILSMVILIVAFQELNGYSKYANLQIYKAMANSYNQSILSNCADLDTYTSVETDESGVEYHVYKSTNENDDKYVYYKISVDKESGEETTTKEYCIDAEKCYALNKDTIDSAVETYVAEKETYYTEQGLTYDVDEIKAEGYEDAIRNVVKGAAREAAAQSFKNQEKDYSFLWIHNVWYSDTTFNTTIAKDYSTFTSKISSADFVKEDGSGKESKSIKDVITESDYTEITYNLTAEKSEYNGYFILVVLSIGLMFLSQFIAMKSQKAQNDLGTVNGQGKTTQKVMMFLMPVIFGFFAFQYSAAFSIYMIISSAYSILTMVVTNIFVTMAFRKKEEKMMREKYNRVAPTKNRKTK